MQIVSCVSTAWELCVSSHFCLGWTKCQAPETARAPKSRQVNKWVSDKLLRGFPGGPAARAPRFPLQGARVPSLVRGPQSHMPLVQPKKKSSDIFTERIIRRLWQHTPDKLGPGCLTRDSLASVTLWKLTYKNLITAAMRGAWGCSFGILGEGPWTSGVPAEGLNHMLPWTGQCGSSHPVEAHASLPPMDV